ncbi:hypothetical protein P167DRAFT_410759 [Morchella conica CCBAS932]|uniref:Rad51-like C-terminal domain-containing protein n=1 Tax=Morchella conica CCBAS932 TaxID=1392247 RepID=A0A3N4L1T9_9PEZI|nr:hypothetical protein P167DRAFT_410759 [Morchella conica CCBAS932]
MRSRPGERAIIRFANQTKHRRRSSSLSGFVPVPTRSASAVLLTLTPPTPPHKETHSPTMSDLHILLPTYTPPTPSSANLLAAFSTALIPTTDLLTQDALALSRRLGTTTLASVLDIKLLTHSIASALNADTTTTTTPAPQFLTTGDTALDVLLGGGIRTCCITEFVGESRQVPVPSTLATDRTAPRIPRRPG